MARAKKEEEVVEEVRPPAPANPEPNHFLDTTVSPTGVVVDQELVYPDFGRMVGQRAVFDTSGTAGEADHDMRVAYPIFDERVKKDYEEGVIPEHLQKQLDGPHSLDNIYNDAYRP